MRRVSFTLALGALLLALAIPMRADRSACSLLEADAIVKVLGRPVINVREQNRATFSSCSFETDDWQQTVGLIYFPNLAPTTPEALAAEYRADLERDQVPYVDFAVQDGLGAPAVYYRSPEDDLHSLIIQPGSERVILTGPRSEVVQILAALVMTRLTGARTPP